MIAAAALTLLLATAMLLAALAGLALSWRGWRGRRAGDHAYCRLCGFDLSGHTRRPDRCSECGSKVRTANAVVIGQRRREPRKIMVGLALAILSVSPLVVVVWPRGAGTGSVAAAAPAAPTGWPRPPRIFASSAGSAWSALGPAEQGTSGHSAPREAEAAPTRAASPSKRSATVPEEITRYMENLAAGELMRAAGAWRRGAARVLALPSLEPIGPISPTAAPASPFSAIVPKRRALPVAVIGRPYSAPTGPPGSRSPAVERVAGHQRRVESLKVEIRRVDNRLKPAQVVLPRRQ